MDEASPFYRNPHKLIPILSLMVIVIYLLLMGRQGDAQDVVVSNGLAYVAVGSQGGLRIVDVSNPSSPQEIGHFDSPGSALRSTLANGRLYLADGKAGVRILDVSDPTHPVQNGVLNTPGEALHVAVLGNYAYVALGEAGLVIADISNPNQPFQVSQVDTPGSAQAVAAVQVAPTGPVGNPVYGGGGAFVYVADGSAGLEVVDARLPIAPAIVGMLKIDGSANDLIVIGPYALIAGGPAGLVIASLSDPLVPVAISQYADQQNALRLALNGSNIYLANGEGGLTVVNADNPALPQLWLQYSSPGSITKAVSMVGSTVLVADGYQGVKALDLNGAQGPYVTGLYETPGEASILDVLRGLAGILSGGLGAVPPKIWHTLLVMAFDFVLFAILLVAWLAFYAQFILPVHSLGDRGRAFERLFYYHLGRRGPAIFIENGEFRERTREELRTGPGVALLDTASGAVFRTQHAFTRPAGPGVTFTNAGEYPAGVVDLHRQSESLGPLANEDPFAKQGSGETANDYQARQDRRYQTSALTRDGVEVVPNVSVTFQVDSRPGEGRTQFGYNPEAVWKAIAGSGIDPNAEPSSEKRRVSWNWLPRYMAADLWREYLRKFTLDELFVFVELPEAAKPQARKTAFEVVSEMITARMKLETVDELDENGHYTGQKIPSREHELLDQRGIKIHSITVRNLRFPAEVEEQLENQWKATWLDRAQEDMKYVERIKAEERNLGQDQAMKEFAIAASQPLAKELETDPELSLKESLEQAIQGTLKLCNREAELNPRLTTQKSTLVELIEWIRKQA